MKFGVREIADVVLRAKTKTIIGNRCFNKDEPVIYFDTAKTSTLEGAATTVYAQGGKGNSRLIAWEGERTVTFTMEDALISPLGFSILSGAGLIEASTGNKMQYHVTTTGIVENGVVDVSKEINMFTNPKILTVIPEVQETFKIYAFALASDGSISEKLEVGTIIEPSTSIPVTGAADGDRVLLDYYVEVESGVMQMEITPDKFGGYYYLEAATLFRRQDTGFDMPAQFIVPNVKIQSAFTFSLASTGDPSTFTFTMDAFPDYIKGGDKKVLFALQVLDVGGTASEDTCEMLGY